VDVSENGVVPHSARPRRSWPADRRRKTAAARATATHVRP